MWPPTVPSILPVSNFAWCHDGRGKVSETVADSCVDAHSYSNRVSCTWSTTRLIIFSLYFFYMLLNFLKYFCVCTLGVGRSFASHSTHVGVKGHLVGLSYPLLSRGLLGISSDHQAGAQETDLKKGDNITSNSAVVYVASVWNWSGVPD